MLLAELVATSAAVAATRSRKAKVAALAELLGRVEPEELEVVVVLPRRRAAPAAYGPGLARRQRPPRPGRRALADGARGPRRLRGDVAPVRLRVAARAQGGGGRSCSAARPLPSRRGCVRSSPATSGRVRSTRSRRRRWPRWPTSRSPRCGVPRCWPARRSRPPGRRSRARRRWTGSGSRWADRSCRCSPPARPTSLPRWRASPPTARPRSPSTPSSTASASRCTATATRCSS